MSILCRFMLLAVVVISVLTPGRAGAQCEDWSRGFGTVAKGLNGSPVTFKVFDDGSGPALYVGGSFAIAGGQPANGIARWDGSAWAQVGGGLGYVAALEVYDDGSGPALYAGGQFRVIGGAPADYFARWNGTAWESLGSGPEGAVSALKVFDDGTGPALYAGGSFDFVAGQPTEKVARWDGVTWRGWSGGPLARTRFAMAYDAARQRVVLFGGRTADGTVRGDTWTWDGSQWNQASTSGPGPRVDAVMTYDPVGQRVLLVGGSSSPVGLAQMSIWAWDGDQWSQIAAPGALSARINFAMGLDAGRGRLVVYGGRADSFSSSFLDETWEYDGAGWSMVTVGNRPVRRIFHTMVYDPVRARMVMFGGSSSLGFMQDTWEFDGTAWTQVASAGPAARATHAMAYDTLRSRVVMFGGSLPDTAPATDTWTWNGSAWMQIDAGETSWPKRSGPMVYDIARDRLYQRSELGTSWEFDTAWTSLSAGAFNNAVASLEVFQEASGPALFACGSFSQVAGLTGRIGRLASADEGWGPIDQGASLNIQEGRALASADLGDGPRLFLGGNVRWQETTELRDIGVAQWDGASWSRLTPETGAGVLGMSILDDGDGPALYVAGGVTWGPDLSVTGVARWDGQAWSSLGREEFPSARRDSAVAYDPVRGECILYGGAANLGTPAGALGDTWAWNGRTWSAVAAGGPGPRFGHAMTFDTARSRVLLVGGGPSAGANDSATWAWDGVAWSLVNAGFGGGSRTLHAVAYDSARDRVVAFGGVDNAGAVQAGTWEFDGTAWSLITMDGPMPRHSHAMAYDPARQRTVLFAGVSAAGVHLSDVWEWDGAVWVNASAGGSSGVRRPAMTYDAFRGRVLAYGGVDASETVFGTLREWDGAVWTTIFVPGGQRYAHVMAFDDRQSGLLVFGGVIAVRAPHEFRVAAETKLRISRSPADVWPPAIEELTNARAISIFDDGAGPRIFIGGDFTVAGPSTPSSRIASWGPPCAPPDITNQPDSVVTTYDQNVFFTVAAVGAGNLGYRWRHNGVPIDDAPGRISGSRTPSLRIFPGWSVADTGAYDVIVHSAAGDTASDIATLNVVCPADLTGDSLVDFADYLEFLNLYDTQDLRVDYNQDGLIDFADYLEFLNLYEAGC